MGTNLIIRNADFSANAIGRELVNHPIQTGGIAVTAQKAGWISSLDIKRLCTTAGNNGILIRSGSKIHLKGLKGVDGLKPALRLDFAYYNSDLIQQNLNATEPVSNVVGTYSNYVSANYLTLNTAGDDEIEITNNYGSDYYFGFVFCGPTKDENLSPSDYNIQYYIL